MKCHPAALLSLFVLSAAMVVTGNASAEVESQRRGEDVWHYRFEDDLLNSAANAVQGMTIVQRRHPKRVQLIRPRVHFVPELLKAVEQL